MSYIVPTTIGTRSARALKATIIMATSKSFFGLRRGSTKDFTFSTYRGKQVTKSRVVSVANPQTLYQMEQRMRLVQVANAATKLKGLINHSFEGVAYGQDSIGHFRAMNLTKDALTPVSWVPKGVGDCGVADFIVSKGTLPSIESEFVEHEAKSNAIVKLKQVTAGEDLNSTTAEWIRANNLQDGDQLTFLAGFQNGPGTLVNGKYVYFHAFAIERLIIKVHPEDGYLLIGSDPNGAWSSAGSTGNENFIKGEFFKFWFSTSKESAPLTTNVEFVGQPYASSLNFSFDMFGIILSRKDGSTWRRSFCRLATKSVDEYPYPYDVAAPTYIKSTTSSKFLNLGPQKTGILGNQ